MCLPNSQFKRQRCPLALAQALLYRRVSNSAQTGVQMRQTLALSVLLGVSLMFFQNCGQVKFSEADAGGLNSKLTVIDDGGNEITDGGDDDSTDDGETTIDDGGVVIDDGENNEVDDGTDDHNCNDKKKHEHVTVKPPRIPESEEESEDDSKYVACIVERNGKSGKLAIQSNDLFVATAVSHSVCVTQKGCLEIAAQKFDVIGIEDRGYCDHNPNVVRKNDVELQALVDKE